MSSTLLLVDPSPIRRVELGEFLRGAGYRVFECEDSRSALRAAQAQIPDLVVSALAYGLDGGPGLYRSLIQDPDIGRVPFLFLGSKDEIKAKARGLLLGIDGYLPSPFEEHHLLQQVQNILFKAERIGTFTKLNAAFSGTLEDMNWLDLIQIFVQGNKTGMIVIETPHGGGMIWFENGRILDAASGSITGEDGFFELLSHEHGSFSTHFREVDRAGVIIHDADTLVLHAVDLLSQYGEDLLAQDTGSAPPDTGDSLNLAASLLKSKVGIDFLQREPQPESENAGLWDDEEPSETLHAGKAPPRAPDPAKKHGFYPLEAVFDTLYDGHSEEKALPSPPPTWKERLEEFRDVKIPEITRWGRRKALLWQRKPAIPAAILGSFVIVLVVFGGWFFSTFRWSVPTVAPVPTAPLPTPAAERSSTDLLDEGRAALEKGDYLYAMGLASEVLKRVPGHLDAQELLEGAQNRKRAMEVFTEAVKEESAGNKEGALEKAREALDLFPQNSALKTFHDRLNEELYQSEVALVAKERAFLIVKAKRDETIDRAAAGEAYRRILRYFPDDVEARKGLQRLAGKAPALPPDITPPPRTTTRPAAKPKAEKERLGTLVIQSEPAGRVLLDGKAQGNTPKVFELGRGNYEVWIEREGYAPFRKTAIVRPGESTTIEVRLQAQEVTAEFESIPWGQLMLDGKVLGNTPLKLAIPSGVHQVMVVRDGFHTVQERITVPAGKPFKMRFVLEPLAQR